MEERKYYVYGYIIYQGGDNNLHFIDILSR